jgi:hypothetical protein
MQVVASPANNLLALFGVLPRLLPLLRKGKGTPSKDVKSFVRE